MGDSGGQILVTLQNGLSFYEGGRGDNYVDSITEATPQLRSFTVSESASPRQLTCDHNAFFIMKMATSTHDIVNCPSGCGGRNDAKVYGTDTYSPTSSVCRAAIHAGVLTNAGGEVELIVQDQTTFQGSQQNGVQTLSSESYLRSFSFLSTGASQCFPFSFLQSYGREGKSRQGFWKEENPGRYRGQQQSFYVDSFNNPAKPRIGLSSYSCTQLPKLLLLRTFNCDHYDIHTVMSANVSRTTAGIVFGYKNENSFFTVMASIEQPTGDGKWLVSKVLGEEVLAAGPVVPYRFHLDEPILMRLSTEGRHVQAWASQPSTKDQPLMIANLKDISEKDLIGHVGISVCEAPTTGVAFLSFDVTPSASSTNTSLVPANLPTSVASSDFLVSFPSLQSVTAFPSAKQQSAFPRSIM